MKLGTKISLGFTAVLTTGILLGGISVLTMNSSVDRASALSARYVPKATMAADIERETAAAMLAARSYGLTSNEKFLVEAKARLTAVGLAITSAEKLASDQHLPMFAESLKKSKKII